MESNRAHGWRSMAVARKADWPITKRIAVLAATSAGTMSSTEQPAPAWLALIVAAYAWRAILLGPPRPGSPPPDSGQSGRPVLGRAAYFIRQKCSAAPLKGDKLGLHWLAALWRARLPPGGNTLQPDGTIAPLLPHYRTPIPERYPEYKCRHRSFAGRSRNALRHPGSLIASPTTIWPWRDDRPRPPIPKPAIAHRSVGGRASCRHAAV